jgi:hypothetical protein
MKPTAKVHESKRKMCRKQKENVHEGNRENVHEEQGKMYLSVKGKGKMVVDKATTNASSKSTESKDKEV